MNRYAAQQPGNASKMASNVMSGAKDMASKVGAGAKDMASKVGAGAKDMASKAGTGAKNMATQAGGAAKDFAGRMANKVGDAIGQRGVNQAKQQLGQTLARKMGGATANQITAQGYNQAAKQVGKQALKQGAKRLAALAGPAAAVAGAGMTGYEIGDKVVNPLLVDKYTTKQNKYGEKSNAVERGIGKLATMLPESMGGISEAQYQDMYGDAPAKAAPKKQASQGAIDTVNKLTGGQSKKAPNMSMEDPSKATSKEKQTQAQFNRPAMEEQVKAGNEPNKFVFDKDTKFKDAFNEARKGGVDEFEWGGKKYHTFHQKELDDKSNTRAAKYRPKAKAKEAPVQGKTFKDNITGKTRQAPPPGISEDAPTSAPVQRPSRQAQEPMNMKDFGRTDYQRDRGAVMADRVDKEDAIDRSRTTRDGGRETHSATTIGGKPKTLKEARLSRRMADISDRLAYGNREFKPNSGRQRRLSRRGISDAQLNQRQADRNQGGRFIDRMNRPSRKEMEAMTRSEESSVEKLKKHMEKTKTSKKEGV
jgi:hypothetical protein